MVQFSNDGLKTGLKKSMIQNVVYLNAKSGDITIWLPDTHSVHIQVFGIQMVTVL